MIDFKKEKWVKLTSGGYYISNYGRIGSWKKSGFYLLIPSPYFSYTIYYNKDEKITKHVKFFLEEVFGSTNLEFTKEYRNYIRSLNKKENRKNLITTERNKTYYLKKDNKNIFERKCTDCGKKTNNYRCDDCWKKMMEEMDFFTMDYLSTCSDPELEYELILG